MGDKKNKKGRRRHSFNKASGLHHFNVKQKILLKTYKEHEKIKILNRKRLACFSIKKRKEGLKVTFSKIVLQKAKRYKCMKDNISSKIFIKSVNEHIEGNRIININKLREHIIHITQHSALCHKAFDKAVNNENVVVLETEKRNGFYTLLTCKCTGCGLKFNLENSDHFGDTQLKDINVRCVWGSMVTGGGCSSLNESMGTAGVPGITEQSYSYIEKEIGNLWKTLLDEEMSKAAEEEKQLAIMDDDMFQGVPAITVICDGGWSKRSHKHTYNAMAGVGVIFGARTKKLLHIGIRNKLCYICTRAETQKVDPVEHDCYKNWNCSSQSMECDIILEGFLMAENKYGIRYMRLIGDGDSSVYSTIVKSVPVWGPYVEKIECSNHATKCLRANLERLVAEKPHYKGKGKLTKNNIRKICSGVRCAIIMRSKEDDRINAVKKLKQDIRNTARHVFGMHNYCSTDFCKHKSAPSSAMDDDNTCDKNDEEEDLIITQCDYWIDSVKEMTTDEISVLRHGGKLASTSLPNEELLKDVFIFLNRMSEKANRLIGNFTSNLAEAWMNIKCKFEGGKIYNKCYRGSFYARCYGGALWSLFGPAWSPQVYNRLTGVRPDAVYINTYHKRSMKYLTTKKSQKNPTSIQRRKKRKLAVSKDSSNKKAKLEYGANVLEDTADITAEELAIECDSYYKKLVSSCDTNLIEKKTRGQSSNSLWFEERKKRLTTSYFGGIMSRSRNNNNPQLVKRMLYSNFKGNMYTIRGLNEEENARIEYSNVRNENHPVVKTIEIPGLIVDNLNPFLATSTDGIVHEVDGSKGLMEIKTLLQNKKILIKEAARNEKTFCLKVNEKGTITLKRNHKYYFQIQGQLNITKFSWCDFVIRRVNPHDIYIERIFKDENLWINVMLPKLRAFYFSHMLPELAVPRQGTVSGIRKPCLPWYTDDVLPSTSKVQSSVQSSVTEHNKDQKNVDTDDTDWSNEIYTAVPLLSSKPNTRSKRHTKLKFVGRRIKHQWKESDGTLKWYYGTVLSVSSGKDGDQNAVYQVLYDGEDDCYDIESMSTDYQEGLLKFVDI